MAKAFTLFSLQFLFTSVLVLSLNSDGALKLVKGHSEDHTWCVAKPSTDTQHLANNLDIACSLYPELCDPIKPNGSCYIPDTLINHVSVAMNLYYAHNGRQPYTCDFAGSGLIVHTDPSYKNCHYICEPEHQNEQVSKVVDGGKKPPRRSPPLPPLPSLPAKPGYYTLAYQWAPSFCARGGGKCKTGHRPGRFTIHGLWPENVSGTRSDVKFDLSELNEQQKDILIKIMPDLFYYNPQAANQYSIYWGFWKNEWDRHGNGSGNGVKAYFQNIIDLDKKLGYLSPTIIRACAPGGKKCDTIKMVAEFKRLLNLNRNPPTDIQIICTRDTASREQIQEIWLKINKDGKTVESIFPETNCTGPALFPKK